MCIVVTRIELHRSLKALDRLVVTAILVKYSS